MSDAKYSCTKSVSPFKLFRIFFRSNVAYELRAQPAARRRAYPWNGRRSWPFPQSTCSSDFSSATLVQVSVHSDPFVRKKISFVFILMQTAPPATPFLLYSYKLPGGGMGPARPQPSYSLALLLRSFLPESFLRGVHGRHTLLPCAAIHLPYFQLLAHSLQKHRGCT